MEAVLEQPTVMVSNPNVSLNDKALTVNLRISQWTARKYDKRVSDEVEKQHNAKDAGRYNKMLISTEAMKPITKVVSKLREFHYENTLPWSDSGDRLLPSMNYQDYVTKLNELRTEFDNAVAEFVANYPHYVQDGRNRLGDMFNEADYPSDADILDKFGVKPVYMPIPDTDFRVALKGSEVAKLKSAAETEIQERLNNAMADVWHRIKEQLVTMRDKLSDKDAIFRNTLFGNLESLITLLPKLNITNDLKLHKISEEMKSLMADPDTVRSDNGIRSIKAAQVEDIMERYKDFF